MPEIVCNKYEDGEPPNFIPQERNILVRKWTGTALLGDEIWASFFCTGDYVLASGDFNGDGRSDVLCGVNKAGIAGTSGLLVDLMASTTSELGGTTRAAYNQPLPRRRGNLRDPGDHP